MEVSFGKLAQRAGNPKENPPLPLLICLIWTAVGKRGPKDNGALKGRQDASPQVLFNRIRRRLNATDLYILFFERLLAVVLVRSRRAARSAMVRR